MERYPYCWKYLKIFAVFFTIWNVNSAVTYKCRQVVLSHKSVYFGHQQTDTIIFLLFSCTMHCRFHCLFLLCNFQVSFYQSLAKANGVNQAILLCFVKGWLFNVQTATAENEEQVPFSNIVSIQFQNCDFFLWSLLWSRGFIDVDKLYEKY